ncbi:MAG: site-specific recombinases/DNA [Rhodospirillaceae bacterium]|nr:MAG: site-specific recombinases/DNA [Rhodospirillaceae bacterium]
MRSIPAAEAEAAVVAHLHRMVRSPEVAVRTWRTLRETDATIAERDVRAALARLDKVWDELFPAEQNRLLQIMVQKVVLSPESLDIHFRSEGLDTVVGELRAAMTGTECCAA